MQIYMVELTVADVAESTAWYRDRFDFRPVLHDKSGRFALLEEGPVKLALKEGPPIPGTTRLVFESRSLDDTLARFAVLGTFPTEPLKVSPEGYRQAVFHDPDGHRVAVFEWTRSV